VNIRYNHDKNQFEIEKFREVAAFRHLLQNLRKSEQISLESAKITTNFEKNVNVLAFLTWKTPKKKDESLLKYWDLSGAKACKSCRSRQELSNEYLLAKIGVDTAENEPLKVHLIFKLWDLIFTEPPRPAPLHQGSSVWPGVIQPGCTVADDGLTTLERMISLQDGQCI